MNVETPLPLDVLRSAQPNGRGVNARSTSLVERSVVEAAVFPMITSATTPASLPEDSIATR